MDRYPHTILIQKPSDNASNPYKEPSYNDVYKGRCRCYLNGQSRFRSQKVMDSDFAVSIPDPHMVTIGETYKVCIRYNIHDSIYDWDLMGYVKDFIRYDRNCYIYFQVIKENQIEEDMPK